MGNQQTIRSLRTSLFPRFSQHSNTPNLDAQVLLAHILGRDRGWILAHPEYVPTLDEGEALEEAATQIENGTPLPYVIGTWEFFGLPFSVTPDVLIPRPETELLVETALAWLRKRAYQNPLAADVGTGSGCIAVSLATHFPNLKIIASDISPAALKIAENNARRHMVSDQINFVLADLLNFDRPMAKFDLICANLPYIPTQGLHALKVYGKEPTLALDGGSRGLDLIERMLNEAREHIAPRGLIILEIDGSHRETSPAVARKIFPSAQIKILSDLSGHARLLRVELIP